MVFSPICLYMYFIKGPTQQAIHFKHTHSYLCIIDVISHGRNKLQNYVKYLKEHFEISIPIMLNII